MCDAAAPRHSSAEHCYDTRDTYVFESCGVPKLTSRHDKKTTCPSPCVFPSSEARNMVVSRLLPGWKVCCCCTSLFLTSMLARLLVFLLASLTPLAGTIQEDLDLEHTFSHAFLYSYSLRWLSSLAHPCYNTREKCVLELCCGVPKHSN